MKKIDDFIEKIEEAFEKNELVKITIGSMRQKLSYLKNIFIKPILLKDKPMLSFVYRHLDKDVTKNFTIKEAAEHIETSLEKFFFNAELYTTTSTIYYTSTAAAKEKIIIKPQKNTIAVNNLRHDKQKKRLVMPTATYLHALDITTKDGVVKADMQHKYKQINRYVEIIDGILKTEHNGNTIKIIDMGSGKGYLTFALYDYLKSRAYDVQIDGIELRDELVQKCNAIAKQANYTGLRFVKGSIESTQIDNLNMLIALHACDTATDDAIIKGIKANATYIICAPCCHKQIRKQMKPSNALKNVTKHGILLERQAEIITDSIRALILEAYGYKTKVFEFIEEEATPKNVMIAATKLTFSETVYQQNMEKVNALKALFEIKEHYLERIFSDK